VARPRCTRRFFVRAALGRGAVSLRTSVLRVFHRVPASKFLLVRVIVPEVPGEPRPALLCCSIPAIPWLGAGIGEALASREVFAAGAVMLARRLCSGVLDESPPAVDSADNDRGCQQQNSRDERHGNPQRGLGECGLRFLSACFCACWSACAACAMSYSARNASSSRPRVVGDGADEAAIEDAAGKLAPFFVLERLQENGSRCALPE